jgi:SAM-dependent methyltransferase
MPELSSEMWTHRYDNGQTGWDLGQPSNPLRSYIDILNNKALRILIPGGGNGYEAEYLAHKGFKNTVLLDWSQPPLDAFAARNADFPHNQLVCEDFFGHQATYDLILEQTFFCAIDPSLRAAYAKKAHELLAPSGKLVGVLFNTTFEKEGPPFGGTADEYHVYFEPYFHFRHFEACYNSIPPRAGNELWMELERK